MSPPTRRGAPIGSAPHRAGRQAGSEQNNTSAKAMHLHLARLAGVDVDTILGDLAQMGWTLTADDIEIISEFARSRIGAVR